MFKPGIFEYEVVGFGDGGGDLNVKRDVVGGDAHFGGERSVREGCAEGVVDERPVQPS